METEAHTPLMTTGLALLAAEGVAVNDQRALIGLAQSDPSTCRAAFEGVIKTTGAPGVLRVAAHLTCVGRKPDQLEKT